MTRKSIWYSTPEHLRHRVGIKITIPIELKAYLVMLSAETGISVSRYVEESLIAYLQLNEIRPERETQ